MLVTISFDFSGDLSELTHKEIKALTAKLDKYGYGEFWEIDGDTLTIDGSADFDDYDYNEDDVAEEIRYVASLFDVDLDGRAVIDDDDFHPESGFNEQMRYFYSGL